MSAISGAFALKFSGDCMPAAGRTHELCGDAISGRERQYYVLGWHCDCDWRDGGCRHRDDRKCAQKARAVAARASGRSVARRCALASDYRRGDRGRPGAVFFAADHYAFVYSGLHFAGAGRPLICAAGADQNLCDGRSGWFIGDAGASTHGLYDSGQIA